MATGNEMAMKAALNLAFKMFGIDSASVQQDILTAADAVLVFGARLESIEANQRLIMATLLKMAPTPIEDEHGETSDQSIRSIGNGKIQ